MLSRDIHCFLYHCIAYGFEFFVLGQRNALRHSFCIGADHFFSLFVPQIVQGRDALIGSKFIYDSVDHCFDICLQISVLFFAACF